MSEYRYQDPEVKKFFEDEEELNNEVNSLISILKLNPFEVDLIQSKKAIRTYYATTQIRQSLGTSFLLISQLCESLSRHLKDTTPPEEQISIQPKLRELEKMRVTAKRLLQYTNA